MGKNSKSFERRDKILGCMYSRTSAITTGRKFQIVNSAGKHTNAVLSCLPWMRQNLADFVRERRIFLNEQEKRIFCRSMFNAAQSDSNSIDMLQLSNTVKEKLLSIGLALQMEKDKMLTRNLADLVMLGMSKNQTHVRAIASNSRKTIQDSKVTSDHNGEDGIQQ